MKKDKGGRPPEGPFSNKRATLTARLTEETRTALERAAKHSGNSISQEVELRLRESLRQAGHYKNFGRQHAGFGAPETFALFRLCSHAIRFLSGGTTKKWFDDPWQFARALEIVNDMVSRFRPAGSSSAKRPDDMFWQTLSDEQISRTLVDSVLKSLLMAEDASEPGSVAKRDQASLGMAQTFGDEKRMLRELLPRLVKELDDE